jgi:hypothetical protein
MEVADIFQDVSGAECTQYAACPGADRDRCEEHDNLTDTRQRRRQDESPRDCGAHDGIDRVGHREYDGPPGVEIHRVREVI